MEKKEMIHEGKAKKIYATSDPNLLIQYFKDDATAFNAQKKGTIINKGILNNSISSSLFEYLEKNNIKTHFVRKLSDREMLIKRLSIIPIEIVVRNYVAGSLSKRMGIEEGGPIAEPILEFYYKNDMLGDPMINDYHIYAFNLCPEKDLSIIKEEAFNINKLLIGIFKAKGIKLVDFKLEFGRYYNGEILLGDEISPDGCRLWDVATDKKMDKDRFRRDLGNIEEAYEEVYKRICC